MQEKRDGNTEFTLRPKNAQGKQREEHRGHREEKKRKEKKREEKSRGDELQDGKASGLKGWATGWEDLIPEGVSYRRERLSP